MAADTKDKPGCDELREFVNEETVGQYMDSNFLCEKTGM